jgi:phenylpyruvate tautomerase PptA (4-oxalocrotonate tautomerase family)
MPTAAIETSRHYTRDEESALIAAVQDALTTALRVPPWTTVIRLFIHEAHRFAGPPGKSDWYTVVSIDCFIGRSMKTKRAVCSLGAEPGPLRHSRRSHQGAAARGAA